MTTYTRVCLRNGIKCSEINNTLTNDELIAQKSFWNVDSFSQLLQRWNDQTESKETGLKWIYYPNSSRT